MVDFNKLARKARILGVEYVSAGREFVIRVPSHVLKVAGFTSYTHPKWSHADTDRLAKFFGHSKEMYELLEKLHREEALKTSAADVEVAALLKKIDAACFND